MGSLINDLRYGARMLWKNPGFTLIAVLTLGLGIGSTTMIYSVVNAVLLRPLPFPDANRVVRIEEKHARSANPTNLTYAGFLDLSRQTDSFESIAAARFFSANLTDGNEPEQVNNLLASARYFSVLGITPMLGRAFLPEEDAPGGNKAAILSYRLWQRRYGEDPGIVGKTIRIGSDNVTVVGVMPRGFQSGYPFPGEYDLWTPLIPGGQLSANRRSHLLGVIGRLKQNVAPASAQAELSTIANRIERQNPGVDPEFGLSLIRLQDRIVAPMRLTLIVFLWAVGLLLLIACANVANLMLARAAGREREMAIRSALGAGRMRLARQLLTESLLLALLGGAAGILLALWGVQAVASLNQANFPRINEVTLDARVLGVSALVSIFTGLTSGLAPALQLPKLGIYETLKEGGRGMAGIGRGRLRQSLVIGEVALSLVLLLGAGLLISSFARLMQVDRGFDPDNVLTVNLNLPFSKYPQPAQQSAVMQQILERVSSVPNVRSAGLVSTLPFTGGPATGFEIEGRPAADDGHSQIADIRIADGGYFRTLAIQVREGRIFDERDGASAPRVMIINEEMARRFWPNENPVGRNVTMTDWGPPLTGKIIGIAGNVKADGLDSDTRPMIYWPYQQFPSTFNNLVLRVEGEPLSVLGAVQNRVWSVDRQQPLTRIQTMDDVIAGSVAPRRFNMLLLGIFAAMALLLAVIGIYGVISYAVSMRTREIGIRMALGAQRTDVSRLVVRQGMTPALIGVGIGLVASLGVTRLMSRLLFGVSPVDPLTFALAPLLLIAIALIACYLPARRATKIDPLAALHCE